MPVLRLQSMAQPKVTPGAYRRMTLVALVMVATIIVTGAAVRLSGSGLGCPDWPNCDRSTLVGVANSHQVIEQVNRLFTGAMMVALIVTVLGSLRRVPRRRDLTRLSLALVVGVVAQGVVGGIVVRTHLHPAAVQLHYVLSIVIVTAAMVLHRRAGEDARADGTVVHRATVPARVARHVRAVVVLLGATLLAGTVVTGSGPHSGSASDPSKIRRFGFAVSSVARVHSALVWATLLATLGLALRLRGTSHRRVLDDALSLFVLAALAQGGVGYVQYALGVPAGLVGLHVLGSVIVWIAALNLWLTCRTAASATAVLDDTIGAAAALR